METKIKEDKGKIKTNKIMEDNQRKIKKGKEKKQKIEEKEDKAVKD